MRAAEVAWSMRLHGDIGRMFISFLDEMGGWWGGGWMVEEGGGTQLTVGHYECCGNVILMEVGTDRLYPSAFLFLSMPASQRSLTFTL